MKPLRLKAPRRGEHDLQMEVARTLWLVLGHEVWWTALDHANARDALTGAIRKARGGRPGIPDFIFCWAPGQSGWVELKAEGGQLSAAQQAVHLALRSAGHRVGVCRSTVEVLDTLIGWGVPIRRLRVAA